MIKANTSNDLSAEEVNLIAFANMAESSGFKTSAYYRVYPQIVEARAKAERQQQSRGSGE